MSKQIETAIKNLFFIVFIEMIGTPLGLWLYVYLGRFHIVHVMLGVGYLAAIIKLFEAANILVKYFKFVNTENDSTKQE